MRYPCPNCGAKKTVPIAYGFPSPELFEEADAGLVKIGGCVIGPDMPTRYCSACDTSFSTEPNWNVDPLDA